MKKVLLFALIFSVVAIIATPNENGVFQRPYSEDGIALSTDTMKTSDSMTIFNTSRMTIDIAGLDSGAIRLERKIYTGAWAKIGDSLITNGQFKLDTLLGGSWIRFKLIVKNDPSTVVRYWKSTY